MSTNETLHYPVELSNKHPDFDWKSDATIKVTDTANQEIRENFEEQPKNEEVVMDKETINEIYGDKEKIIKFLKEKCLTPKEGDEPENVKEFSGEKGTHHSLILPSVNGSKCKKIDWYISDKEYSSYGFNEIIEFEEIRNGKNSLRDSEVIANVFSVIRDFLGELGVSSDRDVEYLEKALFRGGYLDTGKIFKEITDLKNVYWLKTDPNQPLTQFDCQHGEAFCTKKGSNYGIMANARLFKISVSEIE